jgi:Flp pilus assembly protein TadG
MTRARLSRILQRRARQSERGQTLVLVALAAVALFALTALGIDLVRLYDARSEAQNAADHAATTAAHAFCRKNNPRATAAEAITDGMSIAAANGFNNNGTTNTVAITHDGAKKFTATTTRTIQTAFAGIIGWQTLDASATAVADCTTAGGGTGNAIWAGGTSCSGGSSLNIIEISGSNNEVYGGVRSNEDIRIGGSGNDFDKTGQTDPVTYVGVIEEHSNDTFESPTYPQDVGPGVPSPQWPSGFAPSDANASMFATYQSLAVANGTNFTGKVTSITKNGVYYTSSSDGFDVSSVTGSSLDVVLVAPNGPIKMSVSSKIFNPYDAPGLPKKNVLMVSGHVPAKNCDDFVIAISGGVNTWNGIIWSPHGLIEMSGSSGTAVKGTLLAWSVRLNGSDNDINYDASLFAGDPEVLILR